MSSQDDYNHCIRRVDIADGETTTLAGSDTRGFLDGAGAVAKFNRPSGIAIDPSGGFALVAVRALPAPPPHRATPRIAFLAHAVGRTHSHRHAPRRAPPRRSSLRPLPPPVFAITGPEQ